MPLASVTDVGANEEEVHAVASVPGLAPVGWTRQRVRAGDDVPRRDVQYSVVMAFDGIIAEGMPAPEPQVEAEVDHSLAIGAPDTFAAAGPRADAVPDLQVGPAATDDGHPLHIEGVAEPVMPPVEPEHVLPASASSDHQTRHTIPREWLNDLGASSCELSDGGGVQLEWRLGSLQVGSPLHEEIYSPFRQMLAGFIGEQETKYALPFDFIDLVDPAGVTDLYECKWALLCLLHKPNFDSSHYPRVTIPPPLGSLDNRPSMGDSSVN